jgi:hypothetical protein
VAAETLRTIESREQDLALAQADLESRSAAVAEREQLAEAARKAAVDEAERARRAREDLAARERALSGAPVRDEPAKAKPEPRPEGAGFLAGLDAMASASHERRSRRENR